MRNLQGTTAVRPILVAVLLAALILTGCEGIPGMVMAGSGHAVTRELALTNFTTVDASSGFNVEITRGSDFKVTLTADDNFMPYVRSEVQGSELRLAMDTGFAGGRGLTIGTLEARITMPDLRELRLSGAAHGQMSGFTRDIDAKLSGASWLKGSLAAGSLSILASGASHVTLDGSAQDLTVDGSGASALDLAAVRAGNARVSMSGGSSAQVNVLGQLDYDLSGGARLDYQGQPRIGQASVSGGSAARNR